MLEHKIGALPVLEDGRLAGIVTETDLLRRFGAGDRATAPTPMPPVSRQRRRGRAAAPRARRGAAAHLRLLADFDNFAAGRRASRRRPAGGSARGALPLLPVLDTLERALATGSIDPDFYEGVAATHRLFVTRPARGRAPSPSRASASPFDPKVHEAVATRAGRRRRSPGPWCARCGAAGGSGTSCSAPPRSWSRRRRRAAARGGEVPRLLRGAGRAAHGDGRGDQARLPPARAEAPSRPSTRRRARQGRRAVQGDQRGQRGPERSRQARQVRRPRARTGRGGMDFTPPPGAGRTPRQRGRNGRTSAGSATSSPRSSDGARGARPGGGRTDHLPGQRRRGGAAGDAWRSCSAAAGAGSRFHGGRTSTWRFRAGAREGTCCAWRARESRDRAAARRATSTSTCDWSRIRATGWSGTTWRWICRSGRGRRSSGRGADRDA